MIMLYDKTINAPQQRCGSAALLTNSNGGNMMENHSNNKKTVYTLNEYVSYGTSGVCKIESLEQRSFDGEHEESYYKLRPLDNSNSTFYVPIDRAAERLRPLLTKEQIYQLIDEMAEGKLEETEWCSNSRERCGIFQNILHGDDYREMIQMMRSLYHQQERKRKTGHRLSSADVAAMHAAENRMYQEFGVVLNIRPEQVHNFILKRMEGSTAPAK